MTQPQPPASFSPGSPLYSNAALAYRPYLRVRDAWLASLDAPVDLEILDVGCSRGEALTPWVGQNKIIGADHDPQVLPDALKAGYSETICADLLQTDPFGGRRFEGLAAFGMVGLSERVVDDLKRMHGWMKPGGRAWFVIALRGGLRRISRPILSRVTTQLLRSVEDEVGLKAAFAEADFEILSFASSPVYFDRVPVTNPGLFRRLISHYAYVEARRSD